MGAEEKWKVIEIRRIDTSLKSYIRKNKEYEKVE